MSEIYVNQLELSPRDLKELHVYNDYALHRVVYSLFENVRMGLEHEGKSSGILFSDLGTDPKCRRVIIVSNRAPKLKVAERYGKVTSKVLPEEFLNHSRYRFSVTVNAVKTKSDTKKIIPIKEKKEISLWFAEKSGSWGFSVDPQSLVVVGPKVSQFKQGKSETAPTITLSKVVVSGSLMVTDPLLFKKSFVSGIGRAKAFGCGLLQLKPVLSSFQQS